MQSSAWLQKRQRYCVPNHSSILTRQKNVGATMWHKNARKIELQSEQWNLATKLAIFIILGYHATPTNIAHTAYDG